MITLLRRLSGMQRTIALLICAVALSGCTSATTPPAIAGGPTSQPSAAPSHEGTRAYDGPPQGRAIAIFAGGCFWCLEGPFEAVPGVDDAISGYTGGPELHPRYDEVARGRTGHVEAVLVQYDPERVTYRELLDVYWRQIDPTDGGGQFADRGPHYRPVIYVATEEERAQATASRQELEASGRFAGTIVVPIEDAETFWIAEDNHQNYYRTNPTHYQRYRVGSGRAGFLESTWSDEQN